MNLPYDTIIVGAGLAGACAAFFLSRHERVLLLESNHPAAGASGAAAGLANPLMGRRARPVWRVDEALETLHHVLEATSTDHHFQSAGILRPATNTQQARIFRNVATTQPRHATWMASGAVRERFPNVIADEGALFVSQGGAVDVRGMVHALLSAAQHNGAEVRLGIQVVAWDEDNRGAFVTIEPDGQRECLYSRRVLLAMGFGYRRYSELARLNLHAIKGQTVRVSLASSLAPRLPISGTGYVVPESLAIDATHTTLVLGSSYERAFSTLAPSASQTGRILEKTSRMLPGLRNAVVLDTITGVRVTVPGTRLPMIGRLPNRSHTWIFTGLGSKGLLMAPLLARDLIVFFEHPDRIPPEIRIDG